MKDLAKMRGNLTTVNRYAKAMLLQDQEFKCAFCGQKMKTVGELHHKNGCPYDNRPDNLVVLCSDCHHKTKRSTVLGKLNNALSIDSLLKQAEALNVKLPVPKQSSQGFVRKKIINGRPYYYLVKSVRVGGKVRQKVLKYLGTRKPRGIK